MVDFDALPQTSRSLILATLGLEIASANCTSIFDLARKREQSIDEIWRDVCRRTAQPRCRMPQRVLETQYTATGVPSGSLPAICLESAAATANTSPAAPSIHAPPATFASMSATPFTKVDGAGAAATAGAWSAAHRAAAHRGHQERNWRVMLAVGVGVVLVVGVGLGMLLAPLLSTQTTAGRPDEVVRTVGAKPSVDPPSVPPPQGTMRRMDAIKNSFSK